MASLRRRGKRTYLSFRMFGGQSNRSVPSAQAEQIRRRADRILDDLASGALTLPAGVDPFGFVSGLNVRQPTVATLTQVLACGEDDGDLAKTTRLTMSIHTAHLKRISDGKTRPESIDLAVLQKYVAHRMGEGVSGQTALRELHTLRRQWNLAHRRHR